jgi:hypothetical protein
VVPLLIGIAVVALVVGGLVIGGRRNKEGIFETALQPVKTEEEKSIEQGGITIKPLPTVNIVVGQKLTLTITSPADGTTVSQNKITVTGETIAGADVSVNEKDLTASADGNFSTTISLEEGENPILITAGNEDGFEEKEIVVYYEK